MGRYFRSTLMKVLQAYPKLRLTSFSSRLVTSITLWSKRQPCILAKLLVQRHLPVVAFTLKQTRTSVISTFIEVSTATIVAAITIAKRCVTEADSKIKWSDIVALTATAKTSIKEKSTTGITLWNS